MKYISQPLQKAKENFGGFNDVVIKNLPKWSEKAAQFMAAFVRIGLAVIRGAKDIFNAIKRIFDMIPKEIKVVTAALAALALFIRAGPIGKLITIISLALLLLEDFYTYLDGGNALLGGLWQKLIDIWAALKNSGAIDKFKESFKSALNYIVNKLKETREYLSKLYGIFKDSKSLEKFRELLRAIGKLFSEIAKPLGNVGKDIAGIFTGAGKKGLEWFIQTGLPSLIEFFTNLANKASDIIGKLNELGITEKVIKGLLLAFLGFKALEGTTGLINNFAKVITGLPGKFGKLKSAINIVGAVTNLKKAFNGLSNSMGGIGKAFGSIGKIFAKNPFLIWIVAIAAVIGIFALLFKNKERVQEFVNTVKEKLKDFVAIAKDMVAKLVEILPELVQAGIAMIQSIIDGIVEMLPAFVSMAFDIMNALTEAIIELLPIILDAGIQILMALINGIIAVLPKLLQAIISIILALIKTISQNLPKIISAGISILKALINGIISILPLLIEAAINLIMAIVDALIENLPSIIDSGIQILLALIDGIVAVLPELIQAAIDLIISIVEAIIENLPMIIEAGINIIIALIEGLIEAIPQLVAALPQIITAVVNGLGKLKDKVLDLGKELIKKLWEGISSMTSWIGNKISGFVKGLFNKEKLEVDVDAAQNNPDTPNPYPVNGGDTPYGYADGGIVTKEQKARIAEGNKPEAVIPLTKPARAKELMSKAMNFLGMDAPDKLAGQLEGIKQFTSKATSMLDALNSGLNSGNASYMYSTNNNTSTKNTFDMRSEYKIYDSSGRPEATANAVDRSVQMRIRNLQGILN